MFRNPSVIFNPPLNRCPARCASPVNVQSSSNISPSVTNIIPGKGYRDRWPVIVIWKSSTNSSRCFRDFQGAMATRERRLILVSSSRRHLVPRTASSLLCFPLLLFFGRSSQTGHSNEPSSGNKLSLSRRITGPFVNERGRLRNNGPRRAPPSLSTPPRAGITCVNCVSNKCSLSVHCARTGDVDEVTESRNL